MKTIITLQIKKSIAAFAFLLFASAAMAAAPTIVLIGPSSINHQVATPYTDMGATAVDENGVDITASVKIMSGAVNGDVFGIYRLTYGVTDGNGQSSSVTRLINVTDLIAPTITSLNGSTYIEACLNDFYFTEPQVTASDNYFPSVQITRTGSFDITALGTYTVVYTATDGAGNISIYTRTIKVIDCTSQSTGIERVNNQQVKAYPNPATEKLSIELKYDVNYTATLFSVDGKAVVTKNINTLNTDLQLTDLEKGLYTLQLIPNDGGSPIQQKIIIK